jgi:Holliday junction resolvasome RuvABC endonuclease subunit
MLVGIDYSLNSPAVCIETLKEGKPFYNFITVQKKDNKCNRKLNMLNDVQVIVLEKDNASEFDFIDKQTDTIIQCIEQIMNLHKDKELIIGIEDYIYYSQQSSLIDIVQATTVLKYKIIKKWGEGTLNKYSPTHVKKTFAENGKASKDDMLFAYNRMKLTNPFAEWCHKLSKSHKPEEDCIDAFAVLYTLKSEMNK